MSGTHRISGRLPYDFPQTPADPVALHRISHLLGDREAHPGRVVVAAIAHLHDEGLGREGLVGNFDSGGGSQEIRPVPQSLHENSCGA
jgi:hypothetical protein